MTREEFDAITRCCLDENFPRAEMVRALRRGLWPTIDALQRGLDEAKSDAIKGRSGLYAALEDAQTQRVRESQANTDLARANRALLAAANNLLNAYDAKGEWPTSFVREEISQLRAAVGRTPATPVWLIERVIDGRPHWLRWRGIAECQWVTSANLADQFDWHIAASREARLISQAQGIECQATEHLFLGDV
jgi:hypothetical protein